MGLDTAGLVAGANRARSIVAKLKSDIEAPMRGGTGLKVGGQGGQLSAMRDRLADVVKGTDAADNAAQRLGGTWRRLGSDQTLWRHFEGGPGSGGGGGMLDTAVKTVATYHALRMTIFGVATGAQMFREHLEASGQEATAMYGVASAIEQSFTNASHSMHDMVSQAMRNVGSFVSGDMSDPIFRDQAADKEAARQLSIRKQEQAAYAEKVRQQEDLKRKQEEYAREEMRRFQERERMLEQQKQLRIRNEGEVRAIQFQLEEHRYGENEKRIRREAFLNQTVIRGDLLDEAKRVDRILAKRKAIEDVNKEGLSVQQQLDQLQRDRAYELEMQAMEARRGPAGGGAFVLGSVAEYQARAKAMQAGQGNTDEAKHNKKVEALLEKMNSLQQQLIAIQRTGDHVFTIPGAA